MSPQQLLRGLTEGDERCHVHRKAGDTDGPVHSIGGVSPIVVRQLERDDKVRWVPHGKYPSVEVLRLNILRVKL